MNSSELGPAGLGADRWQDIAILCPRIDWLHQIERELKLVGIPTQLHSTNETQAGSTPRSWFTALVWIAAQPEDSFEIAGMLRDIFGVSDHDMAIFTGGNGQLLRLDRFDSQGEGTVHEALAILHRACAGLSDLPLHLALRQLLDRTRLRDRLVSLEEETPALIDRELDEILTSVRTTLCRGCDAGRTGARTPHDELAQTSPAEEEIREAVQLCTCQKAKGLEWQTVIVPYLFRRIGVKSPHYPRLVIDLEGNETVYRNGADFALGAKEFVARRELQQFERLLYVTCTRPRHTLLFIDDETAFAEAPQRGISSFAQLLRFDEGEHRNIWKALPETLTPRPAPQEAPVVPELIPPLPPLSPDDLREAVARANRIPRRITPHALAIHSLSEAEPENEMEREDDRPSAENPGIRYGTWWHEFMESIPWSQPRDVWRQKFNAAQTASPQPERSAREWALFCDSELARWLETPGLLIHNELPFLWPENEERCLEGIMDLAIYSPRDETWRVIDWKTNRLGP